MKPKRTLRSLKTFCLLQLLIVLLPPVAAAHDGPPFPLIVDQRTGPCITSVWTDPDVGDGTFFVIVNPLRGETLPSDLKVEVGVEPVTGRLSEVVYPAVRDDLPNQVQFKAIVKFDAQEFWRVRVRLNSASGQGEAVATVEATPPGFGRWDLLIYLLPFLGVGFLWVMVILRKRRHQSGE